MNATNIITGGCYCGEIRYQCVETQAFRGLCYCRTCQTISGGAGNLFMAVDAQTFQFTKGTPRAFSKRITHGLQRGTFARFAEFILLHAQNAHQARSSSRLARWTTPVCSKALNSLLGLRKCRSFICCRPACRPIRRFHGLHHQKMPPEKQGSQVVGLQNSVGLSSLASLLRRRDRWWAIRAVPRPRGVAP